MSTSTTTPNQIGSLVFCSRCGNLLDLPGDEDHLTCDACGQVEDATAYEGKVITTKSNPAAFPSSLRQIKTSLVKNRGDVEKKKVYVDEVCEKCGKKQMSVKTMQLRSADEGATVFYTCERCSHSYRLNNCAYACPSSLASLSLSPFGFSPPFGRILFESSLLVSRSTLKAFTTRLGLSERARELVGGFE